MFKVDKSQHVLAVSNFNSAVKYFTEKLGFTLKNTIGGFAFLHLDNFHLMVGDCQGEVPARETNNHALFAYLDCEGIHELYDQYKERGIVFNQTISDKPWGLREFGVETPEGHRILFGQEINGQIS